MSDAEIAIIVTETCPHCTPKDSVIPGDFKQIAEISEGASILGFTGEVSISRAFRREYKGKMNRIKACGILPFDLTPDHLVLTVEGIAKGSSIEVGDELVWKPASKLREYGYAKDRDYLVISKPLKKIECKELSLRNFTTKRGVETALGMKAPLKFPLDIGAWLLGLYVAEGCPGGKGVRFCLGSFEKEMIAKVIEIGRKLGYSPCMTHVKGERETIVEIPSRILSRAFPNWCGRGARNKRIPQFIMYNINDDVVRDFLSGYISGDGCVKGDSCILQIATASKILALQLQLLLVRFNRFLYITRVRRKDQFILGRKVDAVDWYSLKEYKKRRKIKLFEDYFAIPIAENIQTDFEGRVFNLETEDATYLVNNIVVHNCETLKETLKEKGLLDKVKIINASTTEGRTFAVMNNIMAVPTCVIINKDGNVNQCSNDEFIKLLENGK